MSNREHVTIFQWPEIQADGRACRFRMESQKKKSIKIIHD
jgi:hypothetical protein